MDILWEIGYRLGYCLFAGVLVMIGCMAEKCAFIGTMVEFLSPIGFAITMTTIFVGSILLIIFCGAVVDPDA